MTILAHIFHVSNLEIPFIYNWKAKENLRRLICAFELIDIIRWPDLHATI